jgi:hypothetical protein
VSTPFSKCFGFSVNGYKVVVCSIVLFSVIWDSTEDYREKLRLNRNEAEF